MGAPNAQQPGALPAPVLPVVHVAGPTAPRAAEPIGLAETRILDQLMD